MTNRIKRTCFWHLVKLRHNQRRKERSRREMINGSGRIFSTNRYVVEIPVFRLLPRLSSPPTD